MEKNINSKESQSQNQILRGGVDESAKLKPLRTYKGDLARVIGTKKGSLVGIASAESDRRYMMGQTMPATTGDDGKFAKKVGIIILSTMFVVLGAGSALYFYGKSDTNIVGSDNNTQSIIFADTNSEFDITNLSRRQILNELTSKKNEAQPPIGGIENILIKKSFIDENGFENSAQVSADDFLNKIDSNVSASFLRSLLPNFVLGAHSFDGNQPFMILKTSFYENAFASMFEWELNMRDDLSPLFEPNKKVEETFTPNATSTVVSKPPFFNDIVVKNKDARALRGAEGRIILMYSFIDKNTIVITTNENTFEEVLTRLISSKTLR